VRAIYFRYRYSNRSPADTSAVVTPGTELPKEKRFSSSNGVANLVFQSDGNLVIYDENNRPRWDSGTYDKGAVRCIYEQNGDLCVYDKEVRRCGTQTQGGTPAPRRVSPDRCASSPMAMW
jgi:hypothetical protein